MGIAEYVHFRLKQLGNFYCMLSFQNGGKLLNPALSTFPEKQTGRHRKVFQFLNMVEKLRIFTVYNRREIQ